MARKKRVKVGDVFAIQIDDKRYCYGQIASKGSSSDCYIVYDIIATEHPKLEDIVNSPIVFLTFTLHQKIADGEWVVIGNSQIVQNIEFPEFKIDVMENRKIHCMVMNFKGEIIREATEDEARNLENKKSYTPSVLEDAVKAKCGVLPWNPSYNELLYKRRK